MRRVSCIPKLCLESGGGGGFEECVCGGGGAGAAACVQVIGLSPCDNLGCMHHSWDGCVSLVCIRYIAPEALHGHIGPDSDLYALGVIILQVCA